MITLNTGDSTSTKRTIRVNHDAKGGMELTDPKPKGHVEDNLSESVKGLHIINEGET